MREERVNVLLSRSVQTRHYKTGWQHCIPSGIGHQVLNFKMVSNLFLCYFFLYFFLLSLFNFKSFQGLKAQWDQDSFIKWKGGGGMNKKKFKTKLCQICRSHQIYDYELGRGGGLKTEILKGLVSCNLWNKLKF